MFELQRHFGPQFIRVEKEQFFLDGRIGEVGQRLYAAFDLEFKNFSASEKIFIAITERAGEAKVTAGVGRISFYREILTCHGRHVEVGVE